VIKAVASGTRFSQNYAHKLNIGSRWEGQVRRLKDPLSILDDKQQTVADWDKVLVRNDFNDAVTDVLRNILLPFWNTETTSLSLDSSPTGKRDEKSAADDSNVKLSESLTIRTAEEFVCFHYVAFIQNILARLRTMVLSMSYLFVSVCLAISFYPFVPRTQIGLWLLVDLLLIAAAVIYVYVGMERDTILSYITNTRPGLSAEFYLKTAGFLAGPILGLLTAQFPAISESVLSWFQPGALK
jgi:hypothetical protein